MKKLIAGLILAALLFPTGAYAQISAGTINAKQSGTWTVQPGNTANTTAWLVTGTGGTFPVTGTITANIGTAGTLALDATLAKLTITQGAALGANTMAMVGGSVLTAAPTYTTGQISPFSLTTGGLLRVDASGTTVPTTVGALTSLVTNQQAVTATAAVLPTNTAKRVCLKVLSAGTQTVYFGPSGVTTSTGQELSPGDAWCGTIDNSNRVFVIAAGTGSTVAIDTLN